MSATQPTSDAKWPPDKVISLLTRYPLVVRLYEQVREFFGDRLSLEGRIDRKHSGFIVTPSNNPPGFHSASIRLVTTSGNIPAAIAHELLHGKLVMDGFCVLGDLLPHSLEVIGPRKNCLNAWNAIQHEIFFDEFLSLGFDRNEFIQLTSALSNPEEETRELVRLRNEGVPMRLLRPIWWGNFFRNLISSRHVADASLVAEGYTQLGPSVFPEFAEDCSRIMRWISCGDFRSPERAARALNELLPILGLPGVRTYRVHRLGGELKSSWD